MQKCTVKVDIRLHHACGLGAVITTIYFDLELADMEELFSGPVISCKIKKTEPELICGCQLDVGKLESKEFWEDYMKPAILQQTKMKILTFGFSDRKRG